MFSYKIDENIVNNDYFSLFDERYMSQPILEKIGLTKREADVYETLLQLGESPIVDILKATNTHPQLIYPAIDSLIQKGLVIASHRRHRRYVRAESPHILKKDRRRAT